MKFKLGLRLSIGVGAVQFECGKGLVIVQVGGMGLGTGAPAARAVMGVAPASNGKIERRRMMCIVFRFAW